MLGSFGCGCIVVERLFASLGANAIKIGAIAVNVAVLQLLLWLRRPQQLVGR